jgi:DNA-directed RNA polymerase sigma subunit (sigma70/sigma32)
MRRPNPKPPREPRLAVPLEVVAAELGVSTQRVSYLERRALAKLRLELERRGMTFSDLLPG